MKPDREKLIEFYTIMLRIRRFEEKAFELFSQNQIYGTIHFYIGEEAVATGVCANLRRDDYVTSTHRGHGHCIAKGAKLDKMMAELLGKRTGYCQGKGGSMHVADLSLGILGATGIVGAGIPIATGAALSAKMKRKDQVVACFFGDGAVNQGTFHEGINMAAIWELPAIFVCENNLYAVSTRQSSAMRLENIAEKAKSYGIPGVVVDGMDVTAVYEVAGEAIERARSGEGPTLMECKTYRFRGHSRFDPATYRPRKEVEEWIRRDPLQRFLSERYVTEEEAAEVERKVAGEIEAAVKYAVDSPYPEPKEALDDVYA